MWGCILGPMLNETVCSLGNQPLQVPNKTPFFFFFTPSCFQRIFTILSNKEGRRREGISSPSSKHCKVLLIPPPRPVPSAFTLGVAVSHALKVICVIAERYLAAGCDIAQAFHISSLSGLHDDDFFSPCL